MNSKNLFYAGMVIVVLNILAIINGMFYFFGVAGFTFTEWFFFNICAPSTSIFLAGFYLRKIWLMAASVPFMLYFGTGGLFVFGWSGTAIYAQAGHILMSAAIFFTFYSIIKSGEYKIGAAGILISIILFAIFIPFHQDYIRSRPDLIRKLGDPVFEERIYPTGSR